MKQSSNPRGESANVYVRATGVGKEKCERREERCARARGGDCMCAHTHTHKHACAHTHPQARLCTHTHTPEGVGASWGEPSNVLRVEVLVAHGALLLHAAALRYLVSAGARAHDAALARVPDARLPHEHRPGAAVLRVCACGGWVGGCLVAWGWVGGCE